MFLRDFENAVLEKEPKMPREVEKKDKSNLRNLRQLFHSNQLISSFIYTRFGENARAEDVVQMHVDKLRFDVFQDIKLGAKSS